MNFGSYGAAADYNLRQIRRPRFENASSETAFFSIDDAIEYAGDNSRYQKRVTYIFSFQYIIYSFLIMGFPLLLVKPIFLCPDGSGGYKPCTESTACESYRNTFMTENNDEKSITTDFKLYCDQSYVNGLLGSLLFTGSFLAFFFFPYIGNMKGRKYGITIANIMSAVSALVIGLSNNIYVVMVFITIGGFAYSGFEILCFVYTGEASGERFRNYSVVTLGTVWAAAQIVTAPMILLLGDWRHVFIFFMAVPWFISLWPNIKFIYENPRYLNSMQNYKKAREVLNKICAINLRPPFRAKLYGEMDFENSKATTFFPPKKPRESTQNVNMSSSGYLDLFKFKELRKTTLVLLYVWFFRNFVYYGLNYSLSVLGTEVYQNFTITALSETIANLFAARIKFAYGRITSLNMSILASSVSCLLIYFVPIPEECYVDQGQCYEKTISVILAVIAKFSIGLFANILITFTSESYPTEVRSLGMGLTMTMSRIGTVAMPYIVTAMQDQHVNPLVLFGAQGLLAFIIIRWCLNETYGTIMKDFIVDLKGRETLLGHQDEFDSFEMKERT